jgi:hypothetical protein
MVNFFNPQDFALAAGFYDSELGSWQFNEAFYSNGGTNEPVTMKPNTILGYYTSGATSLLRTNNYNTQLIAVLYGGYYGSSHPPTRDVTNNFELMPFIARPRSKAVGAQAGVLGQIRGGELNLKDQIGFTSDKFDHSGQFNRPIQDPVVAGTYFQLRAKLFSQ